MSVPSVSVIIPVHNAGRFLEEAVASVRAQTVAAAEIIVVDDGSTDETPAIIAGLGNAVRVHVQPRAGAAGARNQGAALATGKWLAFLDADDLWLTDKLAAQLAWMRERPDTDVVFGHGCNFRVSAGGRQEETPRPAYLPGAALLRRDYFERHARFDETLKQNDALGWYLHLQAMHARIGVVPGLVLLRRVHEGNLRQQGDGGRAADLRLVRDWVNRQRTGRD